jgi:hypothetical protein
VSGSHQLQTLNEWLDWPANQAPLNKRLFFVRRAASRRIFRDTFLVPALTADASESGGGQTLITAERRGATRNVESMASGVDRIAGPRAIGF